jgi:hypothetical protein
MTKSLPGLNDWLNKLSSSTMISRNGTESQLQSTHAMISRLSSSQPKEQHKQFNKKKQHRYRREISALKELALGIANSVTADKAETVVV